MEQEISNFRINDRQLYKSSGDRWSNVPGSAGDSSETGSLIEKGKGCCQRKQWAEAMDIFNEIIATDLNADEAYFHRAKCELNLERYRLASDDVESAIQLNRNRPDYYALLAELLFIRK